MRSVLVLTVLVAIPALCQPVPQTLIKTPGARPPDMIGFPLSATDGLTVDAAGAQRPVDVKDEDPDTFEDTGGLQSVAVSPSQSLRWRLQRTPPGDGFYLYFLCRTGHQQGYEYVLPDMAYVADVNGEPVALEAVLEVAAVRTYQSDAGWGHDMSWIRSREMVTLRDGDAITIGCTQEYAFVTSCVLVTPAAHELAGLLARCTRAQERLAQADELIARINEAFSGQEVQTACGASFEHLRTVRAAFGALRDSIAAATKQIEAGQSVDLPALTRQADDTARALEGVERSLHERLAPPLRALAPGIEDEVRRLCQAAETTSYHRRQCRYLADVATRYLSAAREQGSAAAGLESLRRLATYTWRARQFSTQAEEESERVGPEQPLAALPVSAGEGCRRGEVLLNGAWEMTWAGTPEAPADGDWFRIRVPHGPWHETVGQFMALDRKWPPGQSWAWYRTRFTVPSDWTAGRLRLRFEAVIHLAEVYVNGRYCGRHIGGFESFELDITGAARPGEQAELLVLVHDTSVTALDKSARDGEPQGCSSGPNHYIISDLWGARFGCIWQDVSLLHLPAVRVRDVLVQTSWRSRNITVKTRLVNDTAEAVAVRLAQDVLEAGQPVHDVGRRQVTVPAHGEVLVELSADWPEPKLWGIGGRWGDPKNLYHLRSSVGLADSGMGLDEHYQRFGFRELYIADGQFTLNGVRLPLQGGGNWYLQEGKAPHGNRWFARHMYRADRGMNVNIHRWHRHGDVAREFLDLGDETGMLAEPEGPYWGVSGIPDIQGFTDWDDPVWVDNVTEHYRRWAWKHGNHPSVALWSVENETFCATDRPAAMLDRFVAFGAALTEEDPTRPVTFHGIENGGYCTRREDIGIVNLHYPSDGQMRGWRERWGVRATMNGEFQSYPILFAMSAPDAKEASRATDRMCDYIRGWTAYYREIELSGALFFLPYITGLVCTSDRSLMGPWGDLLPDPASQEAIGEGWMAGSISISATVPIQWPSVSGPGIKCEQLVTGTGNRSLINWSDPERPAFTPNRAYETLAREWDPMPALESRRAPELIVEVTRGGEPVPGVPVLAEPLAEGVPAPRGAVTDPQGTAWLVFEQAGDYEIVAEGSRVSTRVPWLDTEAGPGYGDIPRRAVALD